MRIAFFVLPTFGGEFWVNSNKIPVKMAPGALQSCSTATVPPLADMFLASYARVSTSSLALLRQAMPAIPTPYISWRLVQVKICPTGPKFLIPPKASRPLESGKRGPFWQLSLLQTSMPSDISRVAPKDLIIMNQS